jgi:hypothetical protein
MLLCFHFFSNPLGVSLQCGCFHIRLLSWNEIFIHSLFIDVREPALVLFVQVQLSFQDVVTEKDYLTHILYSWQVSEDRVPSAESISYLCNHISAGSVIQVQQCIVLTPSLGVTHKNIKLKLEPYEDLSSSQDTWLIFHTACINQHTLTDVVCDGLDILQEVVDQNSAFVLILEL